MHAYLLYNLRLFQRKTPAARSTPRMHEHAAHTSITYCINFLTQSSFRRAERYYFLFRYLRFLIERGYQI